MSVSAAEMIRDFIDGSELVRDYEEAGAALDALVAEVESLQEALREIEPKQQQMVALFRQHGIVFDEAPGNDPSNWQHVAFAIYNALCEVDSIARAALDAEETP